MKYIQTILWYSSSWFGVFLDQHTAIMLVLISGIALVVHIYSIYYMQQEPSKKRFFIYMFLFVISMNILVISSNFIQLFFAWELLGLISYLLISFWFQEKDNFNAGLRVFLINRISDFGLLLVILLIFANCHSFNYSIVFNNISNIKNIDIICLLLLLGALGKSAQIPFHWLHISMVGPLPVSTLLHSATMVTAGVFLLIRFNPLIEHSAITLEILLVFGTASCIGMGLLAIFQDNLKCIMAYSTVSQLGLMLAALGCSAIDASMLHLVNHACFKTWFFLGIGVVIIFCKGEQNIHNIGCLRNKLPWLHIGMLLASCAAVGLFGNSKELILAAVFEKNKYLYYLLLFSVAITTVYIMRLFFLLFYSDKKEQSYNDVNTWYFKLPLLCLVLVIFSLNFGYFNISNSYLIIIGIIIAWFSKKIRSVRILSMPKFKVKIIKYVPCFNFYKVRILFPNIGWLDEYYLLFMLLGVFVIGFIVRYWL